MFDTLLAKGFTTFAQVMVKAQPVWDKYKAIISLVVGILIGWLLIGWLLFPIPWENATPAHLREDWRSAYLSLSADEYMRTGDRELLQNRLGLDVPLENAADVPWLMEEGVLEEDIATAIVMAPRYELSSYTGALNNMEMLAQQGALIPGEGEAEAETEADDEGVVEEIVSEEGAAGTTPLGRVARIAGILLLLLLVIGGAGVGFYLLTQNREPSREVADRTAIEPVEDLVLPEYEGGEDKPVKSFSTPYVLGDDYFDPSFSIEIGNDFLGECGIGISETLGAGDPKKITAFEAWLFDKSDIRTVTKVLASEYAYNDPDLRAKLEPKGEVVLMRPGQEITLETSALRVKALIRDLEYAQGASLPANSFVQKVNFEIQSWVKQLDGYSDIEEDNITA